MNGTLNELQWYISVDSTLPWAWVNFENIHTPVHSMFFMLQFKFFTFLFVCPPTSTECKQYIFFVVMVYLENPLATPTLHANKKDNCEI